MNTNNKDNTTIDDVASIESSLEKEINKIYETLSDAEKNALANFDKKLSEAMEKIKQEAHDAMYSNDGPLDLSKKHPEILHPKHITASPHEITVYVKAEVSEIDSNGYLGEIKDLFEQYYHIPLSNKEDYVLYVNKFFEKFHSNLELTCQEIHAEQKKQDV